MAERKPFLLRLPRDLMDDLERWAKDELRSVNGQLEYLLRDAVRRAGRRKDVKEELESILRDEVRKHGIRKDADDNPSSRDPPSKPK